MTLRMRIDNFDTLEDGGPTWISLDQRGASVGRRPSMDWVLPDPAKHVSSHHFDIQFANGAYWLRDVSTNGTFLQGNRYRIDGVLQLRGGERLIVGHYVIAVETGVQNSARHPVQQAGVTIDPWGAVNDEADPWQVDAEPLQPVNPLPPPRANPHHLDEMAQDFVPLQQPGIPPQGRSASGGIQHPGAPDMSAAAMQQPPVAVAQPVSPGIEVANQTPPVPKAMPMPNLGAPDTVIRPKPRRPEVPQLESKPTSHQDIIDAFCRGSGVSPEALKNVDVPTLVEMLGKSTRLTVNEMMNMLKDRANVKQFTRGGERTMRTASGNNPMKFLPDSEQAFAALFLYPREGYLTGAEGFENALSDLRRHQSAVFAALQPALAQVLTGLSPDEIEEREATSNNILGGSKRTRNWEAFVKRWDEKASEGDNGMLDVFLKAFAKAYAEATTKPQ